MHTFGKVAKFCVGRKAHVFFGRKAVTIKCLRPWVTLAGKHRGTAVPHCHTQTTAWLDKTEGKKEKLLDSKHKTTAIMIIKVQNRKPMFYTFVEEKVFHRK